MEMLPRDDSLCGGAEDPSGALLNALTSRRLDEFEALLPSVDPNHEFGDPTSASILEVACGQPGSAAFVRALLKSGANPNKLNPVHRRAAIHVTAKAGHVDALEELLRHKTTDVNVLNSFGDTAFHVAAKELSTSGADVYEDFIRHVLRHSDIDINHANRKGYTGIHLVARKGSEQFIRELIQEFGDRFDLDTAEDSTDTSARKEILEKYPSLESVLPTVATNTNDVSKSTLFQHLYCRRIDQFTSGIVENLEGKVNEGILNENDGTYTFLQYACENGLLEVVRFLLEKGAEPNCTCESTRRPPIVIACYNGYYKIVQEFERRVTNFWRPDYRDETALHAAVKGKYVGGGESDNEKNFDKCMEIVLCRMSRDEVNATDKRLGNTALHYATKKKDEKTVAALLRSGAYIGVRNRYDEPPLANISPETLERFLDDCLETNGLLRRDDNFELIFRYSLLMPPRAPFPDSSGYLPVANHDVENHTDSKYLTLAVDGSGPEVEPLVYISKSRDLRHLLKHPIFSSFLYLKWYSICQFFFVNLFFYLIFVVLLSTYILTGYVHISGNSTDRRTKRASANGDFDNDSFSMRSISEISSPAGDEMPRALDVVWGFLLAFLILFLLREIFQFSVSPKRYLASMENYMELLLILITSIILFHEMKSSKNRKHVSAIAILLSWAELVLLVGRHPLLSTNIEMLKTVSWNFLKFLAWYSILIVAFALSFYTLFSDCNATECDEDENFFLDPGMSVFKTVVMLTGEFDAASIPFVSFPVTSHVVFVLFVFLIAIVLFNLLNGLAVSDTQAIKNDAELVGYVSRVKLIYYFESMLVGNPLSCFTWSGLYRCCCCVPILNCFFRRTVFSSSFRRKVTLFPDKLHNERIYMFPNLNETMYFTSPEDKKRRQDVLYGSPASCVRRGDCGWCGFDPAIVKCAMKIVGSRGEETELEGIRLQLTHANNTISEYDKRLARVEKQVADSHTLLKQILGFLQAPSAEPSSTDM